jgi:hypothetical protein
VKRLSTSRQQRVRQLLSHEEMGDGKPSQFLQHLNGLAPLVPDDFLRTIWDSRLPPHVQAILAGQTEGSLDSASHLADRICVVTPLPTTAAVTASKPEDSAGLRKRIDAPDGLTTRITRPQPLTFPTLPKQNTPRFTGETRHMLVTLALRG